jgi:hypothetical protein
MTHTLNRKALECLKAMVRAGDFVDKPWNWDAAASNQLLGDPANWTDYAKWFLGILEGKADAAQDFADDAQNQPHKDWFAYPYGDGVKVNLQALRAIASRASAQGDQHIADAASEALKDANSMLADRASACDAPLEITATLQIKAGAAGADGKPSVPTYEMDPYNGGPLRLKGWQHPVVVDLDGLQGMDRPRPNFRDHDPSKIAGHTKSVSVQQENGRPILKASGVMSGQGHPHADEIISHSKNGFPWQASIGARVLKNQFVPEGETAQANGQTWHGPVNIARRTSLGEISFVALGADDTTSARIAANAAGASVMKKKFAAWAKARGLKASELDEASMKAAKALYKAQMKCEADDESDEDYDEEQDAKDEDKKKKKDADTKKKADAKAKELAIQASADNDDASETVIDGTAGIDMKKIAAQAAAETRKAALAERRKVAAITAKLDEFKPQIEAKKFADIEAKAFEEDWDCDRVELECRRSARAGKPANAAWAGVPFVNTGVGEEPTEEIIAAACALNGNVSEKYALAGLNEQQKNIVASGKFRRGFSSIYDICDVVAAAHGLHLGSNHMDRDVLEAMQKVEMRRVMEIRAEGGAGGFSTMSLSGITENILNKAMLEAYGMVKSLVPMFCYETDTTDFKTFKRYRLTASGILAALGATGELKSISLQDESYPNQVKTQGVILNISRQILLNDDMGALTQTPTVLGRGSALYREMIFFANLLSATGAIAPGASVGQVANNFKFFSSGANNYLSGASSALQVSAVSTAIQYFRQQTDANGMPIMLDPDRFLLPPALEATGFQLWNGAELVVTALTSTSAAVKTYDPNINAHKGKYTPYVSPFLSATVGTALAKLNKSDPVLSNFSNASDTAWYVGCNPSGGFAPVQIGYLRGQRVPIIERGETNFNTLGISLRAYYDFGVALHDSRCAVMSAGV